MSAPKLCRLLVGGLQNSFLIMAIYTLRRPQQTPPACCSIFARALGDTLRALTAFELCLLLSRRTSFRPHAHRAFYSTKRRSFLAHRELHGAVYGCRSHQTQINRAQVFHMRKFRLSSSPPPSGLCARLRLQQPRDYGRCVFGRT